MDMRTFLEEISQYLIIIPSAVMCYLPMHKKLRYPAWKTAAAELLMLAVMMPIMALVRIKTGIGINAVLMPALIICFFVYRRTVTAGFMQSLAVYIATMMLVAFPSSFSVLYDAYLHPDSTLAEYSVEANIFSIILTCLMVLLFGYPLAKRGAELTECLVIEKVWGLTIPVSLMVIMIGMFTQPLYYSTLYVGRVFAVYSFIISSFFILTIFLVVIFYFVAMGIYNTERLKEKNRILEMQESRYNQLQEYIERTKKLRHDFRQSVHVMGLLAAAGDYAELKDYIDQYEKSMPLSDITDYCRINAVNALLNYYEQIARQYNIDVKFRIALPDELDISVSDLCSILGNLIENAIDGCKTAEEGERYCYLSVVAEQHAVYIVSTNSFSGELRPSGTAFHSTKHRGLGTGVPSMRAMAEKYGGTADFRSDGKEFQADIMIRI